MSPRESHEKTNDVPSGREYTLQLGEGINRICEKIGVRATELRRVLWENFIYAPGQKFSIQENVSTFILEVMNSRGKREKYVLKDEGVYLDTYTIPWYAHIRFTRNPKDNTYAMSSPTGEYMVPTSQLDNARKALLRVADVFKIECTTREELCKIIPDKSFPGLVKVDGPQWFQSETLPFDTFKWIFLGINASNFGQFISSLRDEFLGSYGSNTTQYAGGQEY